MGEGQPWVGQDRAGGPGAAHTSISVRILPSPLPLEHSIPSPLPGLVSTKHRPPRTASRGPPGPAPAPAAPPAVRSAASAPQAGSRLSSARLKAPEAAAHSGAAGGWQGPSLVFLGLRQEAQLRTGIQRLRCLHLRAWSTASTPHAHTHRHAHTRAHMHTHTGMHTDMCAHTRAFSSLPVCPLCLSLSASPREPAWVTFPWLLPGKARPATLTLHKVGLEIERHRHIFHSALSARGPPPHGHVLRLLTGGPGGPGWPASPFGPVGPWWGEKNQL